MEPLKNRGSEFLFDVLQFLRATIPGRPSVTNHHPKQKGSHQDFNDIHHNQGSDEVRLLTQDEEESRDDRIFKISTDNDLDKQCGPIVVVVAAFALFSCRIFYTPLWTFQWFLPILSPVYHAGERWAASHTGVVAILAHVGCGIVMLMVGILQFEKGIRRRNINIHRRFGRVYVFFGIATIISLRYLRDTVGQGRGSRPDVFMQLFIDASCVCWLTFALGGVAFARFKAIEYHKRFMSLSYAVACTPIMQRVANYFLVFLVVELRLLYEAVISNVPPWEARWGTLPPDASGSSIFLLIGSANHGVSGKTSELVLTFDGYGAGEACVFPLSAWIGLVLALMMGAGMGPSTGTVTAIEDFKEDYGNKYYETTQDLWKALRTMITCGGRFGSQRAHGVLKAVLLGLENLVLSVLVFIGVPFVVVPVTIVVAIIGLVSVTFTLQISIATTVVLPVHMACFSVRQVVGFFE